MKLPPFTLVHHPDPEHTNPGVVKEWLGRVRDEQPAVAESLAALPDPLRRTLLASLFASGPTDAGAAVATLSRIATELQRQPEVVRVGIWDLDALVGALPRIVEALNVAQPAFTFFEVQATIPAGLVSAPARVVRWATKAATLGEKERREVANNVIADDFYRHAGTVRTDLGLDYLVGLTPSMVAGEDEKEIFWNHFSAYQERLILASTYELAKFAREASRPFEALVGGVVVAQLLVAMHYPELGFHADRGCLFDYNADRITLVRAAKRARIEPACLKKIRPTYRAAAAALVTALREYSGGTPA